MADMGTTMTDDRIRALMRRLESTYNEALQTAIKNNEKAIAKYASLTDEALEGLSDEAKKLKREAFAREIRRTEDLKNKIAAEIADAGKTAAKIIQGELANIYGLNYDFTAFSVQRQAGLNLSFTVYDRNQLQVLVSEGQSPFTKIAYNNLGKDKVIVRRLQDQLIQATLTGESQQKIIRRIKAVTGQSTRQAKRVAQTERVRVQSQGRNMAIHEANEMGVITQKQWISRMDARVRDDHADVTGEVVDSGEKFSNGLMFPGDPNGEAEQVINCFIGETQILSESPIRYSVKCSYSGELITIITAGGVKFTGTPNHPILTDKGWVALGKLNKSDNLVVGNVRKDFARRVNPNKDNVPVTMSDFHNFGDIMIPFERIAGVDVNFHGDIPDGDVEIKAIKGSLVNRRISILLKAFKNIKFKLANFQGVLFGSNSMIDKLGDRCWGGASLDVCGISNGLPAVRVELAHPDSIGFTSGSWRNTVLNDDSTNNHSGNVKPLGKREFGIARRIKFHYKRFVKLLPVVISKLNIVFRKNSPDNLIGDFDLPRDLTYRNAGQIELDDIVMIKKVAAVSTHVYNLQTKNGTYLVNSISQSDDKSNSKGVIVHNCRCYEKPMVKSVSPALALHREAFSKSVGFEEWRAARK